jgi:hypothetical protein
MGFMVIILAVFWFWLCGRARSRSEQVELNQLVRVVRRREVLRSWHWNNSPIDRD